MIKRRFYREEHGDRDAPSLDSSSSDSSSSSSDSEVEAEATKESEDHAVVAEPKENDESCSSSSVYESKDISADDIDVDSAGFTNEDDGTGNEKQIPVGPRLSSKHGAGILKKEFNGEAQKESEPADMPDFVLKFKSVYRCRICPRIVCLTEQTMMTHLNSKRHARSEKLLKENRLKAMLNSDGEIENQETPTEMHNRIVALAENKSKKKNKGRQRQKKRSRTKKGREILNMEKTRGSTKAPAKKRHKSEN
ncbi:hypothetical protein P3X46_029483 [Hevea brasiliensis]|uniref:C2H2-type domain-containing protein n=1 Tax=Hevea brasiliensis TaxID=3981 RepID=A0ABQ9KU26_HEVBR|nr:uncharacterized protein LOC110659001 isoform X1 [Hevea brasiliensis]XP_057994749.1 uncharacterized protein LOC110659001 isoform X1 [Hevea brasiliensis]KAJ9147306.1 hypothetical protein P3X46_029483 [Hevea brasiliensis]